MHRAARMKKEIAMFNDKPPFGISCWNKDDSLEHLEAQILGSDGTPYRGGVFKLDIVVPERYPFEPPKIQFVTPIYHPNVDSAGRICLDSLKMPPKGGWKPALNISTLLTMIQLLMAEPNPDDPLMVDIANEFKYNRPLFEDNAKRWTLQHATQSTTSRSEDLETSSETTDNCLKRVMSEVDSSAKEICNKKSRVESVVPCDK